MYRCAYSGWLCRCFFSLAKKPTRCFLCRAQSCYPGGSTAVYRKVCVLLRRAPSDCCCVFSLSGRQVNVWCFRFSPVRGPLPSTRLQVGGSTGNATCTRLPKVRASSTPANSPSKASLSHQPPHATNSKTCVRTER